MAQKKKLTSAERQAKMKAAVEAARKRYEKKHPASEGRKKAEALSKRKLVKPIHKAGEMPKVESMSKTKHMTAEEQVKLLKKKRPKYIK